MLKRHLSGDDAMCRLKQLGFLVPWCSILIGPDVTPERLVLAARLISGLIFPHMKQEEARRQIRAGLALLMDGLHPRQSGDSLAAPFVAGVPREPVIRL